MYGLGVGFSSSISGAAAFFAGAALPVNL